MAKPNIAAFIESFSSEDPFFVGKSGLVFVKGGLALKIVCIGDKLLPPRMISMNGQTLFFMVSEFEDVASEINNLHLAQSSGITPELYDFQPLLLQNLNGSHFITKIVGDLNTTHIIPDNVEIPKGSNRKLLYSHTSIQATMKSDAKQYGFTYVDPTAIYCFGILMENMYENYRDVQQEDTDYFRTTGAAAAFCLAESTGLFHMDMLLNNLMIAKQENERIPPVVLIDLGVTQTLTPELRGELSSVLQSEDSIQLKQMFQKLCSLTRFKMGGTLCDALQIPHIQWQESLKMYKILKRFSKSAVPPLPELRNISQEELELNYLKSSQPVTEEAAPTAAPAAPAAAMPELPAPWYRKWFGGRTKRRAKKYSKRKLRVRRTFRRKVG